MTVDGQDLLVTGATVVAVLLLARSAWRAAKRELRAAQRARAYAEHAAAWRAHDHALGDLAARHEHEAALAGRRPMLH